MGIKVLLVEDTRIAQIVAIKILADFKFHVDVAENGEKAFALVKQKFYDIIFMDIGLPRDSDGFVLTEKIRNSDNPNAKTIIVSLTAHDDEAYVKKCNAYDMNYFLSKPISQIKVQKIINKYNLLT